MKKTTIKSVIHLTILGSAIAVMGCVNRPVKIISPLPMNPNTAYAAEIMTDEQYNENVSVQEKVDKYIDTIFGKDARFAKAIQKAECNPKNKLYPKCDKTITSREYSVGIFQINIQSETAKVHYNRIPGDTLEEKIEWLSDPYNNTLMAYWIFSQAGNFNAWSAYTNRSYLANL